MSESVKYDDLETCGVDLASDPFIRRIGHEVEASCHEVIHKNLLVVCASYSTQSIVGLGYSHLKVEIADLSIHLAHWIGSEKCCTVRERPEEIDDKRRLSRFERP